MSRPPKLSPEVTRLVCAGIRTGATVDDAAAVAGVSRRSVFDWLKTGERAHEYEDRVAAGVRIDPDARRELSDHDRRCARFFEAVREARSAFALEHANAIATAALQPSEKVTVITKQTLGANGEIVETTERRVEKIPPDPRAAMWLLERRLPQTFGRTQRLELSGPDGGEIPVPTDALREELLAKLVEIRALPAGVASDEPVDAEVVDMDDDIANLRATLSPVPEVDVPGEPPKTAEQPRKDAEAASGAEGT